MPASVLLQRNPHHGLLQGKGVAGPVWHQDAGPAWGAAVQGAMLLSGRPALQHSWKEDPKVGSWLTASVHSSATTGAGGTSSLMCSPQRDMLKCSAGDLHHDGEKLLFSGLILQTSR